MQSPRPAPGLVLIGKAGTEGPQELLPGSRRGRPSRTRHRGAVCGHLRPVVTSSSFWIIWAWVPWKGSPSTSMPTLPETPLRTLCCTRRLNIFSS